MSDRLKTANRRPPRALLQQTPVATWRHEPATGRTWWSPELSELLGLQNVEPSLEALLERVPPGERQRVSSYLRDSSLGQRSFDHHVERPDGGERVVQHHVWSRADEGVVEGMLHDITERAAMEQALSLLAELPATTDGAAFFEGCVEQLARLYEVPYAFIALVDDDGQRATTLAVWAGSGHGENFTYDLEGTPCQDVMSLDKELIPERASELYAEDQMLVDMGVESYFGAPLFDPEGRVFGIVSVMGTEPMELSGWTAPVLGVFATRVGIEVLRQRHEQEARTYAAELVAQRERARRSESISRLAAGVGHDFNNLLSVVVGHVERLRELTTNSSAHELLDEVVAIGVQARALTERLVQFGGDGLSRPEPVALGDALGSQRALLRRILGPEVTLRIDAPEESLHCLFDPGQVEQILLNLATNARAAMPEGGRVTITLSRRGQRARLTFSDTGQGIAASDRERVFEPFFSTKPEHGSGIGLPTVRGIVRSAGGSIEVRSAAGAGATFVVDLPIVDVRAEDADASAAPPEVARVLLVEDDERVRTVTVRVLEALGYEVVAREGAEEALELLANESVSIVLTDVGLIGCSGLELGRRIRETDPEVPICFISGSPEDFEARDAVGGPTAFLQKPALGKELHRALQELLGSGSG